MTEKYTPSEEEMKKTEEMARDEMIQSPHNILREKNGRVLVETLREAGLERFAGKMKIKILPFAIKDHVSFELVGSFSGPHADEKSSDDQRSYSQNVELFCYNIADDGSLGELSSVEARVDGIDADQDQSRAIYERLKDAVVAQLSYEQKNSEDSFRRAMNRKAYSRLRSNEFQNLLEDLSPQR
jgi:hypothetical protein